MNNSGCIPNCRVIDLLVGGGDTAHGGCPGWCPTNRRQFGMQNISMNNSAGNIIEEMIICLFEIFHSFHFLLFLKNA